MVLYRYRKEDKMEPEKYEITKPYIVITAGQTYTFSFWYYTDASTTNLTGGLRMWGYWE